MRPIDDLVSFMALPKLADNSSNIKDYPWRRVAYDRTLSCPDLARVINDFLSPGFEPPVQLCA
jgi:hypothetical protein